MFAMYKGISLVALLVLIGLIIRDEVPFGIRVLSVFVASAAGVWLAWIRLIDWLFRDGTGLS